MQRGICGYPGLAGSTFLTASCVCFAARVAGGIGLIGGICVCALPETLQPPLTSKLNLVNPHRPGRHQPVRSKRTHYQGAIFETRWTYVHSAQSLKRNEDF